MITRHLVWDGEEKKSVKKKKQHDASQESLTLWMWGGGHLEKQLAELFGGILMCMKPHDKIYAKEALMYEPVSFEHEIG